MSLPERTMLPEPEAAAEALALGLAELRAREVIKRGGQAWAYGRARAARPGPCLFWCRGRDSDPYGARSQGI